MRQLLAPMCRACRPLDRRGKMRTPATTIVVLAFVLAAQACGESAPPDGTSGSAPSSRASTPPATQPAPPSDLQRFEQTSFCKKYACVNPTTWALNTGATNHSYQLNLTPSVSLEVPTRGDQIDHYGLVFHERDRLDNAQLAVIDDLIAAISANDATDATRRFVRANIERSVSQIRLARSTRFGRYQLWAGKVGNDKIVSIEPIVTLETAASASGIIPFKVSAQSATALVLLVDRRVTDDDLTALIRAVQKARADATLVNLIPATTAGGSMGPYAIINLFVMSDAKWATQPRLREFINPSSSEISA